MRDTMRTRFMPAALCGLLLAIAGPLWAGEQEDLKEMLGADYDGAKVVGTRGGSVVWAYLKAPKLYTLAQFPPASNWMKGLGRPSWSPDGKQVVVAYGGKARLIDVETKESRQIITDEEFICTPKWWVDPATGEFCIVYKTSNGKNVYGPNTDRGQVGRTMLYRLATGKKTELLGFPCDGGLSMDGTHLGEAYAQLVVFDLVRNKAHILIDGDQACNPSISPDNTYRMMYTPTQHERIAIRSKDDKEVWRIALPERAEQWQNPRWSRHPNFAIAAARFLGQYKLVLIRLEPKATQVLFTLRSGWLRPDLWLPSAAVERAATKPAGEAGKAAAVSAAGETK